MANKKRYYFVEVNIPDAVKTANPDKDPSSIMRDLLLAWKDAKHHWPFWAHSSRLQGLL